MFRVNRFQKFLNLAYPQPGAGRRLPSTLRSIAQWRLDRRYFDFPFELSLLGAVQATRALAGR